MYSLERVAITLVTADMRVGVAECVDRLGEHNTEGRVHGTGN
jgi:hypothetical protein